MRVGVNTLFLIPREVGGTEIYVRSVLPALQAIEPDMDVVVLNKPEKHQTFYFVETVVFVVPP
ncbi:MAG: hypothetical protein KJ060_10985, partial [Candidatus Hydrogenedentes bacterium]|nr:hypothetical protein [Candidatus Hydrogenedentota bacterium]